MGQCLMKDGLKTHTFPGASPQDVACELPLLKGLKASSIIKIA